MQGAARAGHRFAKVPVEWAPTTTLAANGVVTADPQELLRHEATILEEHWEANTHGPEPLPELDEAPGLADVDRLPGLSARTPCRKLRGGVQ